MRDRAPAIDAHAYVDNCLSATERKAFEARLRQDEELRRCVNLWQTQSEAIRAAFGAPGHKVTRATPLQPKPAISPALPIRSETTEPAMRLIPRPKTSGRAASKWTFLLRRPATRAALLLGAILLFPGAMAHAPQAALAETGASAFRAFSSSPTATLDFHGGVSKDLARALGPEFLAARVPEWATPVGWTLRGAKRVPGLHGEAVLILLDSKESRPLGVLIEPLDAPASGPIRTESLGGMIVAAFTRRGFGFAVAGLGEDEVDAWLSAAGFRADGVLQPTR